MQAEANTVVLIEAFGRRSLSELVNLMRHQSEMKVPCGQIFDCALSQTKLKAHFLPFHHMYYKRSLDDLFSCLSEEALQQIWLWQSFQSLFPGSAFLSNSKGPFLAEIGAVISGVVLSLRHKLLCVQGFALDPKVQFLYPS
jgi:hypothetical protein